MVDYTVELENTASLVFDLDIESSSTGLAAYRPIGFILEVPSREE